VHASEDTPRSFAYYALDQIVKSTSGKTPDAKGNIKLDGLDALFMEVILESGRDYDLAHFWAGRYEDIMIIPENYGGLNETIPILSRLQNAALLENLGSPPQIIKISPPELSAKICESLAQHSYLDRTGTALIQKLIKFLETQTNQGMQDYLLPKAQEIMALQKGKEDYLDQLVTLRDRLEQASRISRAARQ
jgi:hypothetical protein